MSNFNLFAILHSNGINPTKVHIIFITIVNFLHYYFLHHCLSVFIVLVERDENATAPYVMATKAIQLSNGYQPAGNGVLF